jgi:predicted choloylglycine hydrolase
MKRSKVKILFIILLMTFFFHCKQEVTQPADESNKINELYKNYDERFKEILNSILRETGKEIIKYETLSPNILTKKMTVTGSYYELGYHIGLVGWHFGMYPDRISEEDRELNNAIIKMYEEIHPPFLEKARGLTSAFDMNLEDIDLRDLEWRYFRDLFYNLFKYKDLTNLSKPKHNHAGCSSVSYFLESSQKNFAAKNLDLERNIPHFVVIAKIKGVFKVISDSFYPINQTLNDGLNEKGLFLGMASNGDPEEFRNAGHKPYPDKPAIYALHAASIVLETCRTVDEAVALIDRMNIWNFDGMRHFLIADQAGNSVVIEWRLKDNKMVPFFKEGVYQVMTNTSFQIGLEAVAKRCWRFRHANSMMAAGIGSLDDVFAVMKAIQPNYASTGARTIWTSVADLSNREIITYPWEEDYEKGYRFKIEN